MAKIKKKRIACPPTKSIFRVSHGPPGEAPEANVPAWATFLMVKRESKLRSNKDYRVFLSLTLVDP